MLVDVATDRLKTKISLHRIYSYLHSYWGFENDRLFLKKKKEKNILGSLKYVFMNALHATKVTNSKSEEKVAIFRK